MSGVFRGCRSGRSAHLILAIATIVGGLVLRRYGYSLHLPFVVVKYGGSAMWGAMVYFLLVALAPNCRPEGVASIAMAVSIAVELFRLYHTPAVDAFRLTLGGALLLGRVFSLWNLVAYGIGIFAAYLIGKVLAGRNPSPSERA